jgi:hypothetical protein
MRDVLTSPLLNIFWILLLALLACTPQNKEASEPDYFGVNTFISLLEYDLAQLEDEIERVGVFSDSLFARQRELIAKGDRQRYKIKGIAANSEPGADPNKSSLYISRLARQPKEVEELVLVTNPLDSVFRKTVENFPVVSQVYFNSSAQLTRLYPPYNVNEMLEPNLDLTSFNFYYEADQSNNPERKPVWVDAMYIDPVGRGWMITLTRPVYHNDELKLVLGMDITLNDIIENYVNKTNHQILIVDREGTVVAGKSKTIEVFSLPPLKNHTYTQTITSDSFRKEDFNLFKSRSKEVRRIAGEIINGQKNEVWMTLGQRQIKIVSKKMSKLDWFVLEVFF